MDADQARTDAPQDVEAARHAAVLAELDRILNSSAFRTARRSQEFFRHVVVSALEGRSDLLKERSIGATIFQRAPDYDTGEDSIVRVKASELRKRLAQYYLESGPGPEVTIELPAGSYMPEFRWHDKAAEPAPAPAPESPKRDARWRIAAAVAGLACIAIVVTWFFAWRGEPALERFWAPVLRSGSPALLCVAHPVVFQVRAPTRDVLGQNPPPELVPAADITRDPDHYIGFGDAFALAQFAGYLRGHNKDVSIRMGNDIAFADVRAHPAVLIGAFTNQWTMQLTSNLRFIFDRQDGAYVVRDQMERRVWSRDPAKPNLDYLILSRIFDSRTGDVVITAAGIAHLGTYMAGEFLTNPAYFEQAIKQAPSDWETRNMQLVISAEVIGKTPGPPKVVDYWFW